MRGPTLRQVHDWLGAPGWQGWSTIFSALTLLAAISVAVILFRFSQQEEEKRLEATRATFSVEVDVISWEKLDVGTHEWELYIYLRNEGPAAVTLLRVDFVVGGMGVQAVSEPEVTYGRVSPSGIFHGVILGGQEEECLQAQYTYRVEEPVLVGDTIWINQWFSVDPAIESELLEHPRLLRWKEGLADETLVGAILHSVRIEGPNAAGFYQEWPYHETPCQ